MKWDLKDKFLSEQEMKRLRSVVKDQALLSKAKGIKTFWQRVYLAIMLGMQAGLRISEICALNVEDINFGAEPFVFVQNGKGGKSRKVYIPNDLKSEIKAFIRSEDRKTGPLLLSSHGKQYTTRALQLHFKKALALAGLPMDLGPHCLRHSYATQLYQKSLDLRLCQKQLGHSSVTTTTVYADCSKETMVQAVNAAFGA